MKRIRFPVKLLLLLLLLPLALCDTTSSVEDPPKTPELQSNEFDITGKVVDGHGAAVAGVTARLMLYGLTSVTDATGEYHLRGNAAAVLAKVRAEGDTATDTLLIIMPSSGGDLDSSEIAKTAVKSGLPLAMSEIAVVQREVRAPLAYDTAIGSVEAVVYDDSFPEVTKSIDLWYDTLNEVITGFAWFSSGSGKKYSLYINVYDTAGALYAKSPLFTFPDNAGNILFSDAMKFVRYFIVNDVPPEVWNDLGMAYDVFETEDALVCTPEKLYEVINGEASVYIGRGLKCAFIKNLTAKSDTSQVSRIQVMIMDFGSSDTAQEMYEYRSNSRSDKLAVHGYALTDMFGVTYLTNASVYGKSGKYFFVLYIDGTRENTLMSNPDVLEIVDYIMENLE